MTVRRTVDGKVDGTQIHMLSYLGDTWGRGEPRFTTEQVIDLPGNSGTRWRSHLGRARGAGRSSAQPFLDQLTALGKALGTPLGAGTLFSVRPRTLRA